MKNYSQISSDQFPFLIHKLIQSKKELLKWAREQKKDKLITTLTQEIEILTEAERRLSKL
jgi:hypothetical protein